MTKLTHNQALILEALRAVSGPLTAYQLMDRLKDRGITAPPTVYRALNRLIAEGIVHRIDSLNAFIACDHSHDDAPPHDSETVFAICRDCGDVAELDDGPSLERLSRAAMGHGFNVTQAKVELVGTCRSCRREAERHE